MLKSNYKNNLIINSLVDLGDDIAIEGKGKGRKFVSRFIEPGVAHYEDFGDVLITKKTFDKFIQTMVGCPVIIKHKDIDDKNADKERVGVVSNVWYNEADGWFYCDGIIWDKQAIDLVKNQGWNVSCTYDFDSDKQPKTHNGKKIDMEFTDGEFLHLALVPNPRYERANIVMNSKQVENEDKWITIKPNGEDAKGKHLLLKDGESPKEAIERTYGKSEKFDTKDKQFDKEERGEPKELNKQTSGAIYKGKTWREIFEKRLDSKESKSWWIEKVNKPDEGLLADDVFSHYQLKSEEGYKTKIPRELNDYIEEKFDTSKKYIYNSKVQNSLDSIITNALTEVIIENCLGEF